MFGMEPLVMIISAALWLAIPAGVLYLLLRLVRAYEVRSAAHGMDATLEVRVTHLEENLARLTKQFDQLAAEHRE